MICYLNVATHICDILKNYSYKFLAMVERETIERIAKNSRIRLDEDEIEEFGEDFEEILDAFDSLDDVDVEGVEPAFHPIDLDERKREDSVEESFSNEEALSNSENTEEGYFKGPRAT